MDSPGPGRQSRRTGTREAEPNPESSDTIELNDPQSLLTQADIPKIVDAALNNLPDRDASLPPQDPSQWTDLQEPTSLDLRHIAIIPPESSRTPNPTNHLLPLSPLQSPAVSIGTAIPPVPLQLVERIESGAFVVELIPTRLSLNEAAKIQTKASLSY